MLTSIDTLDYFYYITSDECGGVKEHDVVFAENLNEVYTLLDIKQILLN